MDFGFTNDTQQMHEIGQWRDAAIADGWAHKPTYDNEPEESACSLERDGFKALILTRMLPPGGEFAFLAEIAVWGPDRLGVAPGRVYEWAFLVAGTRRCGYCGATDVDTVRVGFAGRSCHGCQRSEELKKGPVAYS